MLGGGLGGGEGGGGAGHDSHSSTKTPSVVVDTKCRPSTNLLVRTCGISAQIAVEHATLPIEYSVVNRKVLF